MYREVLWRRLSNILHPASVKVVQELTIDGNKLEANTFNKNFVNPVKPSTQSSNGYSSNNIGINIEEYVFFSDK